MTAQKVLGMKAIDEDLDISPFVNRLSRPIVGAALVQAESGRHVRAWRDESANGHPNDVSGGLLQVSIPFIEDIRPPGYKPDEAFNSYANKQAWRAWSENVSAQFEYALPIIERNIQWARAGLGPDASQDQVDLLALLLWNAPNLGILRDKDGKPLYTVSDRRQREAVAKYWLNPDLGDVDSQHAQNFINYRSALNYVQQFTHEQDEGTGTIPTMPDITDYTEPTLPSPRNDKGNATLESLAVAVEDLQARFKVLDKQQHYQTDAFGIAANKMYGPGFIQDKLGAVVSMLRGGEEAQATDGQDDEQPEA